MVSQEVQQLVDAIRQWNRIDDSPEAVSFFDEVMAGYQLVNAEDRSLMRAAVKDNRAVWNLVGDDSLSHYLEQARQHRDAVSYFRSSLLVCSLTGGIADWRDTIVWLEGLWDGAIRQGLAPRPHFCEIAAISETKNCHGISGMSTHDLFNNAMGNRMRDSRQVNQGLRLTEMDPPPRRWWKFWA